MNQPIKFPDMRPRTPPREIIPPPPSAYVQRIPVFPTSDAAVPNRRFERKRLLMWFGIAVALHAALLLGLWLMPTLRIQWEPSPDAWVRITALPVPSTAPPALAQPPVFLLPPAADKTTSRPPPTAPTPARP